MFASVAPVGASPLLGFADVPSWPVSIIDFHGTRDATIPYQVSWDWSTRAHSLLAAAARHRRGGGSARLPRLVGRLLLPRQARRHHGAGGRARVRRGAGVAD